ncbi:MAG: hypothetical protein K2J73_02525 [Oscillospiraceae bacterium]|nr:hypothetical protein [Oscillospiraceae bacterium]
MTIHSVRLSERPTIDDRTFFIGYLPKAVASVLALLMDKDTEPHTKAFRVTGGFNPCVSYGAALAIAV